MMMRLFVVISEFTVRAYIALVQTLATRALKAEGIDAKIEVAQPDLV
jgi:hypothetical protein